MLFADGGLVNNIQNLFSAFIFIPFRDAILAKPFISQAIRVIYYLSCRVILTLPIAIASSSGHLLNIES